MGQMVGVHLSVLWHHCAVATAAHLPAASASMADEMNYIFDFDYVPGQPFVDYCDWHCLNPYTNLERLTLPTCYSLKGHVKAFVQSARHLHIVEYVDQQDDTD